MLLYSTECTSVIDSIFQSLVLFVDKDLENLAWHTKGTARGTL